MIRLRTLQWGGYPGKPNLIAWKLKTGETFPALVRMGDVIVEEWSGDAMLLALKKEEGVHEPSNGGSIWKLKRAREQTLP